MARSKSAKRKPPSPNPKPPRHSKALFNLDDATWIPVIWKPDAEGLSGQTGIDATPPELGLRDTLLYAHEIVEVADQSPLVTAALHRLLIAIVHAIYRGPEKRKDWVEMWQSGSFDREKVLAYFEKWHDRFWLFHPERPFLQWPGDDLGEPVPSTLLDLAAVSGNKATLFDHSLDSFPPGFACSEAARQMMAFLTFKPGGFIDGVGGASAERSALAAPWADGVAFLCQREDLFGTMMMNLMLQDCRNGTISILGQPEWERSTPSPRTPPKQSERAGPPQTYLELLTTPCCHIRLCEPDSLGQIKIAHLQLGTVFKTSTPIDPAKTYHVDKKLGWRPFALRADRALWRDSATLLKLSNEEHASVGVLAQTAALREQGIFPASLIVGLRAFGTIGSQAKLDLWRAETLPIPVSVLENPEQRVLVEDCLALAEDVESALRTAVWIFVCGLVPESKEDNDRKALRDHLDVDRPFWSALETPFKRDILCSLASADKELLRKQWANSCTFLARNVLADALDGLMSSGATVRAGAEAERTLNFQLAKIGKSHNL
jgi:CRISPR system Cascade subunit CasA